MSDNELYCLSSIAHTWYCCIVLGVQLAKKATNSSVCRKTKALSSLFNQDNMSLKVNAVEFIVSSSGVNKSTTRQFKAPANCCNLSNFEATMPCSKILPPRLKLLSRLLGG